MKTASSKALGREILHRYSIVTPSIVHRFDGAAMDMRWRCDGDASEDKGKIIGIQKKDHECKLQGYYVFFTKQNDALYKKKKVN